MWCKSQAAGLTSQGQALAAPAAPPLTEPSRSAQGGDLGKQVLCTLLPPEQAEDREARATESIWSGRSRGHPEGRSEVPRKC